MQVHFATRMNGFKSMSNMLAQDFLGGAYFQQIYLSFAFFGLQNFMTGPKFAIFRRFSVFKLSFDFRQFDYFAKTPKKPCCCNDHNKDVPLYHRQETISKE